MLTIMLPLLKQEGDTIASSNKIMETTHKDWCSELFLLELKMLKGQHDHNCSSIEKYNFLQLHHSLQSTHVRSRTGQSKGVPIYWAIVMCGAWRPQLPGPHIHYPCHQQIKAIITLQCFPPFRDFPILHWLMLVIFQIQRFWSKFSWVTALKDQTNIL